jgi:hypothetical protein
MCPTNDDGRIWAFSASLGSIGAIGRSFPAKPNAMDRVERSQTEPHRARPHEQRIHSRSSSRPSACPSASCRSPVSMSTRGYQPGSITPSVHGRITSRSWYGRLPH